MIDIRNYFAPSVLYPGLQITVQAGIVLVNGSGVLLPTQNVSLSANSTSSIYLNTQTAAIQVAASFPVTNCYPIAVAVTGTGVVNSLIDSRPDIGGVGGGSSLSGTGLARDTGICTELSGDVTTSGSNAATVVRVNGTTVPASATILGSNSSRQLVDNSATLANLRVATVNLSTAQVLAIQATPVAIIASPGAGFAINVWQVFWNYIAGGTGFASVTGNFQLADPGLHFSTNTVSGTNLGIANATTNGIALVSNGSIPVSVDTNYVGTGRVIWDNVAPTTGNGAITVKAYYTIDAAT